MTAGGSHPDQEIALLQSRLAVAEETLRALRAGEVDAIVMDTGQGEQQIYTLETADRPYRHLVERMSEGAALADADGLIVYANQRLATLLGVPLQRLLGQPFSDWLDESERSHFVRRLATAASGGHGEHTLRRSDGGSVPVLMGVSITRDPDGVLRCLTVTDLSAQKAQQQQLDRLNAELTDRLAELSEVNAELDVERIRVEQANVELQVVNEESRRKFVASIDRQSKNMSRLVDDLFTSASIEGGGLTTSPELVVLGEAIDRCLEVGAGDSPSVAVSCSPDLIVRVDPNHLGRIPILDNYVQNAFKYGEPPVRIEATRVGDMVEVRVLDQGRGVPPEFVSRLFGKFARADTPATKAQRGIGLGLSIVRGLAEANGCLLYTSP